MEIIWKREDDKEKGYVGKWYVGCAYLDILRRTGMPPYTIRCFLPGASPVKYGLTDIGEAKSLLEKIVLHWFSKACIDSK